MRLLKKYRWYIGLLCAYFLTRLLFLTHLPIINDESTYIRYGLHQVMENNHAPYSLLIGKEPLLPLLFALLGIGVGDPLLGARLVSVMCGFITLIGIIKVGQIVFDNTKVPLIAGLFYVVAPYTLYFDRLALMDSAVSAIAIWSLYATLQLEKTLLWRYAVLLGVVIGIGLWVKFSSMLYLFLPFLYFTHIVWKKKETFFDTNDGVKLFVLPLFLVGVFYLPLVSHDFYTTHWELLQQYTNPLFSFFTFPITLWLRNWSAVMQWFFFYLTPLFFLLGVLSFIFYVRKQAFFAVSLWFLLPFLYEILFAKMYTSRHALSLVIPFLLIAAYGMTRLLRKQKQLGYGVLLGIVVWSMYVNAVLIFSPQKFPSLFMNIAKADMESAVRGFSSGYGVMEAIGYIQSFAQKGPVTVIIRNDHGNPEDAVVAFLHYQKNVKVLALNDYPEAQSILLKTKEPVFFVSRGGYYAGFQKYLYDEKKFLKPNDQEFVGVYKMRAYTY